MSKWSPDNLFSSEFTVLNDVLKLRAIENGGKKAFIFLNEKGAENSSLTYTELEHQARQIAVYLRRENASGERVLLLFPSGLDFIKAFFGCLLAGAVAVPCYRPQNAGKFDKLNLIAEDSQAKIVLTDEKYLLKTKTLIEKEPALASLRWIATDNFNLELGDFSDDVKVCADDLAFLQYTSGSTSQPKGVMVSHANLIHNQQIIKTAFRQDENSIIAGWLPLYHDMGLIGNVLQTLYIGGTCVLMSPLTFLQKPFRWLEAVSRFRATTAGAPNFAYRHCVEKITDEELSKLDLSSWKLAFNGAEPINSATMRQFAEKFFVCGFRSESFYPCYGLAEATLFVAGGAGKKDFQRKKIDEKLLQKDIVLEKADGREIVSCGKTWGNQKIILVDRSGNEINAEAAIGEICISGKSVAKGYWNKPSETAETFNFVPNNSTEKYLRTGDLGFLSDGEIYVTGRRKDLIILRGRNYYPHDIEETVEKSHPAIRKTAVAAFSYQNNENESLAIVAEIEPRKAKNLDSADVFAEIRHEIAENHEIQADNILLVRAGNIPKTSSGKIRRFRCREMFLSGEFERIAEWQTGKEQSFSEPETDDAKTFLRQKIAHLTGNSCADIKADAALTRYGLDSLGAVELTHIIENRFGAKVSMSDILRGATLDEILEKCKETEVSDFADSAAAQFSNGEIPLSHNQQSLYFLNQIERQSSAYNIARAVKIEGETDVAKLRKSFEILASRHQQLQSRFIEKDSKIIQKADDAAELDFIVTDNRNLSFEEIKSRFNSEADQPFDLQKDVPFRVRIFQKSDHEIYLLVVFHHIISDFYSLTLLFDELKGFYHNSSQTVLKNQSAVSGKYAEFVRQQKEFLKSENGKISENYWLNEFSGELPKLNLPTDFPRSAHQTFAGREFLFELDGTLTDELNTLANRFGGSLFNTLLTAYFAFLSRITNQKDLIVGTPAAGRTSARFAETFGYFVNPLAIRADLSGNPSFEIFHQQISQKVQTALDYQDYPFALLVQKSAGERESANSPIFQTMFVWQNALPGIYKDELLKFALNRDGAKLDFGTTRFESVRLEPSAAQFDLSLSAAEVGGRILCSFQYNADLFGAETISRLAENFKVLLASLTKSTAAKVSDFEIISDEEKTKILFDWNDADFAFSNSEIPLHSLIEKQAAATPEKVAVRFRGEELSFGELNRKANRLARLLMEKGVKTEDFVGIFLNRSAELMISLLAVLKTGAVYVPFDPSYPKARTEFMLEDSAVKLLLTSDGLRELLPKTNAAPIFISEILGETDSFLSENLSVEVYPENAAYMIYTSGSTGKPKGAINSHRAIVNRLLWMQKAYQINENDTVLQKTPYSFDVSVWEFFWSLITGAKLVLAEPDLHADAEYLVETIIREQITTIHFVPSVLRVFLEAENVSDCHSLKRVICSGEALPADLARKFFEKLPRAELHNLYGPTEAAVDVSFWHCLPEMNDSSIPIGKPISNVKLYILDDFCQPVPIGTSGELFIGGTAPARGYWNRPDLTAEKFVPNPFSANGERLYRTGDLARFVHGGEIEYLGRIDNQVKINGVRVELGEIEAAVKDFPTVKDCVVIWQAAEKRLTAYCTTENNTEIDTKTLENFLSEKLPRPVIPRRFAVIEKIPLLPNGKADRKALTEISSQITAKNEYIAPANERELIIGNVWKEVLGAEKIGVDDNFFALGGDSIRAIQVRAKLREHGFDFELQELFRHQTVRNLATVVRPSENSGDEKSEFLLNHHDKNEMPAGIAAAYPLTRLQTGLVFHQAHDRDYEIYVTSLCIAGKFDETALHESVRIVTMRHEILRSSFEMSKFSEPMQLVIESVEPNFIVEDLSAFSAEKSEEILSEWLKTERGNAFDWTVAPLARFTVHKFASDSFQITLSEPILDGWSVATLLTELLTIYAELTKTEKPPELPVPPPFSDYVTLETKALKSDKNKNFWRENLAGFKGCSIAESNENYLSNKTTERIYVEITAEVSQKILQFTEKVKVPIKSVLLAAHLCAVSALTGQKDVATGLLYNGRPETVNAERAVGLFLNAVPFRLSVSEKDLAQIAAETFAAEIELLPHRRFPLSEILRLHGKRNLFDTAFNYTHFHAYQSLYEIEGLKVKDIYASDQTYFPLTTQFNLNHETKTPDLRLAIDYRPSQIGNRKAREFADCLLEILHSINGENQIAPLFKTARAGTADVANQIETKEKNLTHLLEKIGQMTDAEARNLKEKLLRNRG